MSRALFVVCFVACLFVSKRAAGHELRPAILDIEAGGGGRYTIAWAAPSGEASAALVPPAHCRTERDSTSDTGAGGAAVILRIDCGPRGLGADGIAIRGLSSSSSEVLVRFKGEDGRSSTELLRGGELHVSPEVVPTSKLAYLRAGFAHVISGLDHLLFMLGLMLAARTARSLLWAISSFTLAHAVTLALAALDLLHVPRAPVEVCIAASSLLPAARVLDRRSATSEARTALVFGLLHGLGFASALRDLGVSRRELPSALVSFHAGIELGQIAWLAVAGVALAIASQLQPKRLVTRAAAYAIGSIAFAWTIDRAVLLLS